MVADCIELHKLLLDSQLSTSKTYDCRALVVKRGSEEDIKAVRSILEAPTCRMRGLRKWSHISFGKVSAAYDIQIFALADSSVLFCRAVHELFAVKYEVWTENFLRVGIFIKL